jgi:hypothetical protein
MKGEILKAAAHIVGELELVFERRTLDYVKPCVFFMHALESKECFLPSIGSCLRLSEVLRWEQEQGTLPMISNPIQIKHPWQESNLRHQL